MGTVTIHYKLSRGLHRAAKVAAANGDLTLKAFIENAIEDAVTRQGVQITDECADVADGRVEEEAPTASTRRKRR